MKKFIAVLCLLAAAAFAHNAMAFTNASQTLYRVYGEGQTAANGRIVTLTATASTATTTWAYIGDEVNTQGYNNVAVFMDLDINDSSNYRIRMLGTMTSGAAGQYPIQYNPTDNTPDNSQYVEFDTDADQKAVIFYDLGGVVPYVRLQHQVGTSGDTPSDAESVYLVLGWK